MNKIVCICLPRSSHCVGPLPCSWASSTALAPPPAPRAEVHPLSSKKEVEGKEGVISNETKGVVPKLHLVLCMINTRLTPEVNCLPLLFQTQPVSRGPAKWRDCSRNPPGLTCRRKYSDVKIGYDFGVIPAYCQVFWVSVVYSKAVSSIIVLCSRVVCYSR